MFGTILVAGLVMGFASSLHCAGMCGPLGCALLLTAPKDASRLDPFVMLLVAQAGRIASYALLGAAFGVFGAGLYGLVNFQAAHSILQWSAALTIVWTGLSIAGLVPTMFGLDRMLAPVAGAVAGLRRGWMPIGYPRLVLAGLIWGITPCAMVYAALFNSLLTGSVQGGLLMMAAFGLGTLPSVTIASLGLFRAGTSFRATRWGRLASGAVLIVAGAIGLLLTVPGSPLCIAGQA
ncbi:MAG: sulfite exporter TauE/SafE family protein [Devosia sp.]|nr:sulfite exporter TauE/SafE family protein [Devosia sp.]